MWQLIMILNLQLLNFASALYDYLNVEVLFHIGLALWTSWCNVLTRKVNNFLLLQSVANTPMNLSDELFLSDAERVHEHVPECVPAILKIIMCEGEGGV